MCDAMLHYINIIFSKCLYFVVLHTKFTIDDSLNILHKIFYINIFINIICVKNKVFFHKLL